jgi:hypothetical protein
VSFFFFFFFFFCLETKEAKIQGCDFLGYKSLTNAKTSELASLTQQMSLNAFAPDLLNATKPNAIASLSLAPLSLGEGLGERTNLHPLREILRQAQDDNFTLTFPRSLPSPWDWGWGRG